MHFKGEELKKIRLAKGLSLEDVHKKTKIHLNILRAIEGDAITNLSPVYLKGFLKIYCGLLGANPDDFISEQKYSEQPQAPLAKPPSGDNFKKKDSRSAFLFKEARSKISSFSSNRKIKQLILFILGSIFAVFIVSNMVKCISSRVSKGKTGVHLAKTEIKASEDPKRQLMAVAVHNNKAKARKLQSVKTQTSNIRLTIRAIENCWVYLKVDGKVMFQRVLEKGRSESWEGTKRLELSLGNAGGVELEVNGQLFSKIGRRGQVIKGIVITQNGLDVPR